MENLILTGGLPWTIALCGAVIGFWFGRRTRKTLPAARRDEITGLPDKQSLLAALRGQLAIQRRYHTNFSVCLFDADLGTAKRHSSAMDEDERWQGFAAGLEGCSRETEYVARYSDQQFAVILPHTSLEGALVYAERVRQSLTTTLPVNLAAGVTVVLDGDTTESLITRLEEALFLAVAAGGQVFQHTGLETGAAERQPACAPQELAASQELRADIPADNHQVADPAALNLTIWAGGSDRRAAAQTPMRAR